MSNPRLIRNPSNDELRRKSGIYIITNSVSSYFYIGKSNNLLRRGSTHGHQLNRGLDSKRLQKFYDDNPNAIFYFDVLEYCPDDHLVDFEEFWIESTDAANKEIGFNVSKRSCGAAEFTEERKEAMRVKAREEPKGEIIELVNEKGEVLEEFPNSTRVMEKFNFTRTAILRVCQGETSNTRGFIFRYKDPQKRAEMEKIAQEKAEKKRTKIDIFDYNFNFLYTDYLDDFMKKTGLSENSIRMVCTYQKVKFKGFIFRFNDENKARRAIALRDNREMGITKVDVKIECFKEGNYIKTFDSVKSASEELEVARASITSICRGGRNKSAKGYTFKYANPNYFVKKDS